MRKKLHFEIVSRYKKEKEPSTTAVPFAKGELLPEQIQGLQITNHKRCVPAQFKATACWPDGSVKWLLIHFLADLEMNKEEDYFVEDGDKGGICNESERINIVKENKSIVINTGVLKVKLAKPGDTYLFDEIQSPWCTLKKEQIEGPVLENKGGDKYTVRIGEEGWEFIEKGSVKTVLRTKGKHWGRDGNWFDFSVLLTFWAGKTWMNLDYQFVNCEEDKNKSFRKEMVLNNEQAGLKYDKNYPYEEIKSISVNLHLKGNEKEIRHSIYTSGFNFHSKKASESEQLEEVITADKVVETPNEMFPEVLFSIFTGDWKNEKYGIAAGIYQAYQNFPKAIKSTGDGMVISLLPDIGTLLKVPQGVARTSRCYFYFHDPNLDDRALVDRAHQFEMMPVPVPEPQAYMSSEVFGKYVSDHYHFATERFLYRYVDSRAKGLGMLNFGDGPEWEYIKQGRSGGEIIWINNEYDMPHNFMIMLARTGDRRYFDYMKAAAEHWYDVDLCHYSGQPYKQGLLYTHSVDHISGQPVPSHQWVEGFLDYYHMTGNPNGLEAAMSIGENLLKMMELPLYHTAAAVEPREIGWAMRTFMALYRETNQEKWLKACRPIVEVYISWAEELGTWTTPYPDNYMDRVPFMMHVGIAGLYQYYEICPEERIKDTVLCVINDMIEHCYIKRADMFFSKQHPAVRFLNLNGMVLESLAIAYELTGNKGYIEKGLGMFSWITVENQPCIYDFSKYKQDEYTVIYNCLSGPKRCAQTLLPLLHYYRYAFEMGFISNRPCE